LTLSAFFTLPACSDVLGRCISFHPRVCRSDRGPGLDFKEGVLCVRLSRFRQKFAAFSDGPFPRFFPTSSRFHHCLSPTPTIWYLILSSLISFFFLTFCCCFYLSFPWYVRMWRMSFYRMCRSFSGFLPSITPFGRLVLMPSSFPPRPKTQILFQWNRYPSSSFPFFPEIPPSRFSHFLKQFLAPLSC